MKKVIGCVGLLLLLALGAEAQTKEKSGVKKQQVTTKSSTAKKPLSKRNPSNKTSISADAPTVLSSPGTYNAYGNTSSETGRLQISDPTIRMLNERAFTDTEVDAPGSGIIGMPKLAYGIANGHIIFRTTDAPTFGTSTGSGSVGTGTNVGSVGTAGNAIGVNGKNPYAGPGIYGLPITDENFTRASIEGARPKGIRRKD